MFFFLSRFVLICNILYSMMEVYGTVLGFRRERKRDQACERDGDVCKRLLIRISDMINTTYYLNLLVQPHTSTVVHFVIGQVRYNRSKAPDVSCLFCPNSSSHTIHRMFSITPCVPMMWFNCCSTNLYTYQFISDVRVCVCAHERTLIQYGISGNSIRK